MIPLFLADNGYNELSRNQLLQQNLKRIKDQAVLKENGTAVWTNHFFESEVKARILRGCYKRD
jgi:hypothetical protein